MAAATVAQVEDRLATLRPSRDPFWTTPAPARTRRGLDGMGGIAFVEDFPDAKNFWLYLWP